MFDKNKKYGILGLARSGIAAAYKIKSLGGSAFLSDVKTKEEIANYKKLVHDFDCEFGMHSDKLLLCDEWIVSPGLPLNTLIIQKGIHHNIPMISEIEFGYQIKANDSFLIAVTGSNGKSTTASLIAHIISQTGMSCILAGNIGDAFCEFPIERKGIDYIVLEISSFQLDLISTFQPDVSLLLNVTPDHLNRYDSFMEYAKSKMRIFINQNAENQAILNADDKVTAELADVIKAKRHYFSLEKNNLINTDVWKDGHLIKFDNCANTFNVDDLQIKGPHNWANAMASILACRSAGIQLLDIFDGLRSFKSLRHRLQYVNTINGVQFYNDSKATNTDSVKYALLSFDKPIRIIMGGSDKGEDFTILTKLLKERAIKVYVTGDTIEKMKNAWLNKVDLSLIEDFTTCVKTAFCESDEGDIIVLSPACASYDKFRNFEHRGDTFIQIVSELVKEYEKA